MGLSLYGERWLRFWEKDVDAPREIRLPPGSVYISSPACFSHQVMHRDGQAGPELMAFHGLSSARCKLACEDLLALGCLSRLLHGSFQLSCQLCHLLLELGSCFMCVSIVRHGGLT